MKETYCQSCGMPMNGAEEIQGTNADGSKNEDYCKYCYDKGAFTADCTMDAMINFCVPHMTSANPEISEEKAKNMMQEFFPTLKRWKKA